MKEYMSHKKVKAAVIDNVSLFNGTTLLTLEDGTTCGHPDTTKYQPKAGDYLVQYEDGYTSLSPKAAFEAGYKEVVNHV